MTIKLICSQKNTFGTLASVCSSWQGSEKSTKNDSAVLFQIFNVLFQPVVLSLFPNHQLEHLWTQVFIDVPIGTKFWNKKLNSWNKRTKSFFFPRVRMLLVNNPFQVPKVKLQEDNSYWSVRFQSVFPIQCIYPLRKAVKKFSEVAKKPDDKSYCCSIFRLWLTMEP